MARRSYGSGSLVVRADANGAETWYGLWRTGTRRVKRALGPKRTAGSRDGLTRKQAEGELRRRMQDQTVVIGRPERQTLAEAGERYVEHLAGVKQRERTTIQDYRGYLGGHLVPYFGERTLDRIEPEHVEDYLHAKLATLSPKTVTNHLTFLHGRLLPSTDRSRLRRLDGWTRPFLARRFGGRRFRSWSTCSTSNRRSAAAPAGAHDQPGGRQGTGRGRTGRLHPELPVTTAPRYL
jgi:hypothetical protein